MRDNLGRRAGDSLCVVGIRASGTGDASSEQQPFLETRALLAAAREQRRLAAEEAWLRGGDGHAAGPTWALLNNGITVRHCINSEGNLRRW